MPYTVLDRTLAKAAPVTTIGDPPATGDGMTFLDLQVELNAQLLGRSDVTADRIKLWLNQAQMDLLSSLSLPAMRDSLALVLDADQPFYLLPTAVLSVVGAALSDTVSYPIDGGKPLRKIDLMKYRQLPLESDEPTSFFKHGADLLVVYPTPTVSLTLALDFVVRVKDMVDDADHPFLGSELDEALLLAAHWKALRALRQTKDSFAAKNEFLDYIKRRIDPAAAEDEGRIVLSSVPRSRSDLMRDPTRRRDYGLY